MKHKLKSLILHQAVSVPGTKVLGTQSVFKQKHQMELVWDDEIGAVFFEHHQKDGHIMKGVWPVTTVQTMITEETHESDPIEGKDIKKVK